MCDCVIIMQTDRVDGHTPQHSHQLPGLTTFQTEFCSERERQKGEGEEERNWPNERKVQHNRTHLNLLEICLQEFQPAGRK